VLTSFLDKKVDIYGKPDSSLCEQTRQKVKNWKKLSTEEYRDLLSSYSVVSAEQKATTNKILASADVQNKGPTKKTAKVINAQQAAHPTETISTPKPSLSVMTNPHDAYVIPVDIKHPERNGEVKVVKISDMDGAVPDSLVDGFEIQHFADMREFVLAEKDVYTARLASLNQILLEIPSVDYSFLYDADQLDETIGDGCDCIKNDHAVARNSYLADPTRHVKRLLLDFPSDISLSVELLHGGSSGNVDIPLEILPVKVSIAFPDPKQPLNVYITRASCKVGIVEEQTMQKGQSRSKRDEDSSTDCVGEGHATHENLSLFVCLLPCIIYNSN